MVVPASPRKNELLAVFGKLTAGTQAFSLEIAQNLLKMQKNRNEMP
ncbi:MAG: hypothetical protein LBH97_03695 [Treponema sp.]|jgi:hypothetical protein|nr:hypothetical protein [Treponema sp.]